MQALGLTSAAKPQQGDNMNIAEMIISEARERGLQHFFGIPGGGSPLDMMEAGRTSGVDFVSVSHESSAAIMAAYNGLMQDTAGLALAVKGVGAGNLVGGAVNAHFERLPLVCVSERSPESFTKKDSVQHCDHRGLFGAVTKYDNTLRPGTAPESVQAAVFHATDGRPGPVLLNLPSDQGAAECGDSLPPISTAAAAPPNDIQLVTAREMIAAMKRPVVIAGADVIRAGATAELLELVEAIEAAVLVTMDGRGVFPETHKRWAGVMVGVTSEVIEMPLLRQADSVILVGVDAMMTHGPWTSTLPTCELVERSEYETLTTPKARVDGDLKQSLKSLSASAQGGFSEEEIKLVQDGVMRHFERPGGATFAAHDILEIARRVLPRETVLFSETGIYIPMLETSLWPVEEYGRYWGTSGGRTMGLTVPALLGAKLAQPQTPMAGIGADGSLLMRLGELEVFARTGAAAPLIIINDQSLGTMKSRQKSRGMAEYGLGLHPVAFADVARACGLRGVAVDTPEAFEAELKQAVEADVTTLIDARVDAAAYQDGFAAMIGVF